jgi:hypothetical protein
MTATSESVVRPRRKLGTMAAPLGCGENTIHGIARGKKEEEDEANSRARGLRRLKRRSFYTHMYTYKDFGQDSKESVRWGYPRSLFPGSTLILHSLARGA